MAYRVEVDAAGELIRATLEGILTIPEAIAFSKAVTRLAGKHGYRRYLYDVRRVDPRELRTHDLYALGASSEERGFTRRDRRAAVFSEISEDARFFENVAMNRGYGVRCFTDIDAAIDWLTHGG